MFVFLPCFTFYSCDGIVVFRIAYSASAKACVFDFTNNYVGILYVLGSLTVRVNGRPTTCV